MFGGRRHLRWILLALAALALLAPSTSSLALTSADRPITASVADEKPFLDIGIEPIFLNNGNHKDVTLFTVTNRLEAPATITVRPLSGHRGPPPIVRDVTGINWLGVGETGAVTADIACGNASDRVDQVELRIIATTETSYISVVRDVKITCTGEPPEHANDGDDNGGDEDNADVDAAKFV